MLVRRVRHCIRHLIGSVWRRKSLLAATFIISTLIIVGIQYSSLGQGSLFHLGKRINFPLGMRETNKNQETSVPRRNLSALPTSVGKYQEGQKLDQLDNDHNNGFRKRSNPANKAGHHWPFQKQTVNYIPPLRLVHFDLKGAPPKTSYYSQIFPILKEAGANGILIEYEDMFPYKENLAQTAAENAYSKEDIQFILSLAESFNFHIIPLVQTFGHLEYVLKFQEFRHLREIDDYPQSICPSKNESFIVIQSIIDQVVSLHSNLKWLHIGCDEVFHLGYCPKCVRKDRDDLFLSHVSRVAQYVRNKYNIIPIIWDDMLRQMSMEKLKEYKLGSLVEPMVWTYVKDIYHFIPESIWIMYSDIFPNIWAASAFKGAFGETLTVPNAKMHLENNVAWLEVMRDQKTKFDSFRGITITGWQRYDHLATLCELLPAGLPSLILNLLTVSQGQHNEDTDKKLLEVLQCTMHSTKSIVDLENDPYLWRLGNPCSFPGSAVFRLTQYRHEVIKKVKEYLYDVTIHKAWLTEFNIRHNISSPMRIDEGLAEYSSNYYPITSLIHSAQEALREVYDENTVAEWIEQNVYPYLEKMENLWKQSLILKKIKVWPRRPLPVLEELKKYSVGTKEDNGIENRDR